MTTLAAIRQDMIAREPMLGRVEDVSAIAAQTVTVPVLASGTVLSGKFTNKWLLRPDAANSANRNPRLSSNYVSSTGVITHAGAAYTDTTATGEQVEIHEFEPWRLETAIQEALGTTRRVDESYLQCRSDGRYTFGDLPWIKQPSDIALIGLYESPCFTTNRRFSQWGTVSSAGALQPDRWTLTGSGATFARSSTSRTGRYSLKTTRATNDVSVAQPIQAVTSGFGNNSLRGLQLTGVLVAMTTDASSVRVRVTSEKVDGTVLTTSNSDYHTGGGAWEEVSVTHDVDDDADIVRVTALQEVDGDAFLDDLYLCSGEVQDGVRRDRYRHLWYRGVNDYEQNPLTWFSPDEATRLVGQIAVRSRRPYPTFDSTRVKAGTADSDETDCPLEFVTYRALARFFRAIARDQEGNANLVQKANEYDEAADDLAAQHLSDLMNVQTGAQLMSGASYGWIARTR